MKEKRLGRILLCLIISFVMVLTLIPRMPASLAYADVGQPPAHDKSRSDNGDGTYKLELSVTGDADDVSQSDTHINVLIIYDESSSMVSNNDDPRRADVAEDAMYKFVNGLMGYMSRVDIYMAEIGFGTDSNTRQGWTNSLGTIRNHFDDGVEGGGSANNYTGSAHGNYGYNGTNWSSAFTRANGLLDDLRNVNGTDRSGYPTFVVLVTDGGPTAGGSGGTTVPGPNVPWTSYRNHYSAATNGARSIQNRTNTTLYGIYALGTDANLLDDLMYFANTGNHRTYNDISIMEATQQQHDFGLDEGADYYYTAANATALNEAINKIFNEIVKAMGITDVSVSDGTTSAVTASSGEVTSLLSVDQTSYQYWMSIPVDSNNQFKRKKNVNGSATEITYTVDGNKVTWTEGGAEKSVTLNGSVKDGQFKFEWTKDDFPNDLYEYAPNDAKLVNGAVEWDLSNVDVLLDGVTYSVTFDVYPSQTALDYKARLDNGEAYDSVVDEDLQDYFHEDGSLETNTQGSVTYSDSRDGSGPTKTYFENPPAVSTESTSMTVNKEWEGASAPTVDLKLDIIMDGDEENPFYEATLNSAGGWKANFNISAGLIVDGEALAGAMGHDFSFAELDDTQYRWELHAPTVRPMIIDGERDEEGNLKPTMLIKEDKANGYDSTGKTTYTIDGAVYYVDPAVTALTATNHRRSNLNLTKVVTGNAADPDTLFPFTLNVDNIKAPEEEPTNDPNHNSDYWVWFSVRNNGTNVERTTNATMVPDASTGDPYYYAKSGSDITISLKDGDNLRFTNLPSGTTYTFTEGTNPDGYNFIKAENTGATDSTFKVEGQTATGTIVTYDATAYGVTFTNNCSLVSVDPPVQKIIEGRSDLYNNGDFTFTIVNTSAPQGVTAPMPENTSVTNSEEYEKEGKTGYYEFGEMVFSEPGTYVYTVTESGSVDGVTNDPAAESGKTITFTVERAQDGTLSVSPTTDEVELSFTNTYETTEATVKKVWDDNDDKAGKRPESLTVDLMNGSTKVDSVTLNADNEWTATVTGLQKNSGGSAIEYTWEEAEVEDYILTDNSTEGTVTTLTNSYITAPISIIKKLEGRKLADKEFTFSLDLTNFEPENSDDNDEQAELDTEAAGVDEVTTDGNVVDNNDNTEGGTDDNTAGDNTAADDNTAGEGTEGGDNAEQGDNSNTEQGDNTADQGDNNTTTEQPAENPQEGTSEPAQNDAVIDEIGTESDAVTEGAFFGADNVISFLALAEEDGTDAEAGDAAADASGESTEAEEQTTPQIHVEATNDADGLVDFGDIEFTAAGTYTLVAKEVVPESKEEGMTYSDETVTITVKVTKNDEGKFEAEVTYDPEGRTITNTFTPEPVKAKIEAKKELKGRSLSADEFSFTLKDTNGKAIDTAKNDAKGKIAFKEIEYSEEGTYIYTITEDEGSLENVTYDTKEVTVTVKVTNDTEKGELKAEVTYSPEATFTNTYESPETVDTSVTKIWDDEDDADGLRPESITVNLLANDAFTGQQYTLSAENNWNLTLTGLAKYAGDMELVYSWEENTVPEGYEVTVSQDGNNTTLTNVHEVVPPEEEEEEEPPKTGDTTNVMPYVLGFGGGLIALLIALLLGKKKAKQN